jgi:hypothetical protein
MNNEQKTDILCALKNWSRIDHVAFASVSGFSAEDETPTLHMNLWRGIDLCDMPPAYSAQKIVAEGHWDGGRTFSLQIP